MKNYAVRFGFKKRGCEFEPLFGLTVSTTSKTKARDFACKLIEDMTPKEFEQYMIDESKFDLNLYHCEVYII